MGALRLLRYNDIFRTGVISFTLYNNRNVSSKYLFESFFFKYGLIERLMLKRLFHKQYSNSQIQKNKLPSQSNYLVSQSILPLYQMSSLGNKWYPVVC